MENHCDYGLFNPRQGVIRILKYKIAKGDFTAERIVMLAYGKIISVM